MAASHQQQQSQAIWEENDDDEDVPLSLPHSGLRRSQTHGGAYKRIHRSSSGQTANSNGITSPGHVAGLPQNGSSSLSRRHSQKTPSMTRVLQQAAEEQAYETHQGQSEQYDHANVTETLLEEDEDADRALSSGHAYLARHSSMPSSRLGRGNNLGAPWNRAVDESSYNTPSAGASGSEHRMRSNSSTAAVATFNPPISPIEASFSGRSPSNSGFVVTSRPSNSMAARTSAGHPSGLMHGRSLSSTGWESSAATTLVSGHSPSHSRHSSESTAATPTFPGLPRSGPSTPPPASPIDAAILGANNPWSPTAEEKQHFKQFSAHPHHHHANLGEAEPSQASNGSIRRSNSLTATVGSHRARALAETGRQPVRKNTPALPPLVTSSDALYNGAVKQDRAITQTAHPLPSRPLQPQGEPSASRSFAQQSQHEQITRPITNSTKILRGPASAAPYVPAIGHTHSNNTRQQSHQPTFDRTPHQGIHTQSGDRTLNTAGPGIPQASFHRDRERIVGSTNDRSSPASAHPLASAVSPFSAFSASTMQFPSLHNPSSAAALSNNLALQQHLLAQQTAQLQDQQAQLAAALQAGLTLKDLPPSLLQIPASQANGPTTQQAPPPFGGFSPFSDSAALPGALSNNVPSAPMPAPGIMSADVAALVAEKGYNPREFDTSPYPARFFVIKSFTEDDVFKSIKFEIWSSTALGNNRLDKAHKESADKGPIYLFFSVNASGHFCGVAEMLTPLDYAVSSNVWALNDKWKGVMKLRWIFIRDIPNPVLRHLKLTNTNEQKPVTASRDTQEVPYEQGCEMLRIFHGYQSKTSLLQDYTYYQQQTEQAKLFSAGSMPVQPVQGSHPLPPTQVTPGFTPATYYQSHFTEQTHNQQPYMPPGYNPGHSQHYTPSHAMPLRR